MKNKYLKVVCKNGLVYYVIYCSSNDEKLNISKKDILKNDVLVGVENVEEIETINSLDIDKYKRVAFIPSIGPCFDCVMQNEVNVDDFVNQNFRFVEEYELV